MKDFITTIAAVNGMVLVGATAQSLAPLMATPLELALTAASYQLYAMALGLTGWMIKNGVKR